MIHLRTVECIGGPMDGASVDVGTDVSMPDRISVPAMLPGSPKRYIYDQVHESEHLSIYRYDHVEVEA